MKNDDDFTPWPQREKPDPASMPVADFSEWMPGPEMTPWQKFYSVAFFILWPVTFFGSWGACIYAFGWQGAVFGWLPSLAIAYVVAWFWPIMVVLLLLWL